jgi:CRP-like cAMP-binding protein
MARKPTPDELRRLKDEAAEAAGKGKLDKAADFLRKAADGDPRDVGTRQRLAEVLRRAGRVAEAVDAYHAVADRFGKDGLLIKAIAISKIILELDPRHVKTQSALAELYAKRAQGEGSRPAPRTGMLAAAKAAPPSQVTAFARIMSAAEAAVDAGIDEDLLVRADPVDAVIIEDEPLEAPGPVPDERATAAPPPALPRVPIFSELLHDAFLELTRGMVLQRVAKGQPVIGEGEDGTSFYVVASGTFAVTRRDDTGATISLARLREGDFFGEMALLSGARRAATVTAEESGEVLELRAEVLLDLAGRHPHVARSLRRFYRQRLLANAMAVSPVFRPFQRGERKLIMERFRAREVAEGEPIVHEGQPSDGLYVVLEGAVDVIKRKDGHDLVVGQLREGDVFGEMSCLRKAPASASVVVRRAGTLLRLPRKEFDDLVVTYPQILEMVSTLSEERAESLDAILSGRAAWTDDGLVLT